MKCPLCGTPGAYVGLSAVDCVSPSCEHYVSPPDGTVPVDAGDPKEFSSEITHTERIVKPRVHPWGYPQMPADKDWESP